MEQEKEEANSRKRKEAPNSSASATERDGPPSHIQDREPQAKKARLSTILFTDNCEVTHRQLCELLKYAVLGKSAVPKPSWCQLSHQKQLNNVVVFILKGMSQLHFYRFYLEFRFLRKTFRHKFSLPSPTSSFLFDIIGLQKKKSARSFRRTVEGPLISATLRSSIDLQNDPIIQKYGYKNVGLTKCLLTKEEMKTFHFPLPGSPNYENFILTKYTGFITDSSPLFGLDCEVCLTSMGKELTRISLVTEGGYCLIDELVKPDLKILDYLTSFTGITKEILNPVTTKLKDVQKLLRELLPPDAVLVGHCLDLDLRVLKIAEFNLEALAANQEQGDKEEAAHMSVLKCLESMGQKLLFLTQDINELSSYRNCQTIKCSSNKKVLEQARVEVPLFPFNIVEFSFQPFPPLFAEEMKNSMKTKWTQMSTVYAGPFSKDCNVGALKKVFSSLGPVHSITLVLETYRPYFSIQYEVLEAAQLALETMNGSLLEGSCIRVRRLVTELTLECDTLVRELEQDSENQGTIYVAGIGETFKEHLLEQSNLFPDLEAVILPKEVKSRKQKNYCFLKFKTVNSAQVALEILKGKDWKLKGRNALTPRHLQAWLKDIHPEPAMPMGLRIVPPLMERHIFRTRKVNHPKIVAWRWSRKIEKLYHSLSPGTFCLILMPGTKNAFGSHPGLGLMKIKEEEESDTPGVRVLADSPVFAAQILLQEAQHPGEVRGFPALHLTHLPRLLTPPPLDRCFCTAAPSKAWRQGLQDSLLLNPGHLHWYHILEHQLYFTNRLVLTVSGVSTKLQVP
ncbi:RNA exonuclease 5 isoform X7 [Mus musculus]|uniref:RNA exonuclease 5 isoform X7 n=1 Tax=Mus musculus TaxID=10090 RepID=UPI0003D71645|nr:RNA exonuclease 5 isoform X7 [Mus musculus]|eukprot:XP_017177830.1 PREDICTED: putative RNA exonuclease NEF-sp isoform X8 [Mus musculus]